MSSSEAGKLSLFFLLPGSQFSRARSKTAITPKFVECIFIEPNGKIKFVGPLQSAHSILIRVYDDNFLRLQEPNEAV